MYHVLFEAVKNGQKMKLICWQKTAPVFVGARLGHKKIIELIMFDPSLSFFKNKSVILSDEVKIVILTCVEKCCKTIELFHGYV